MTDSFTTCAFSGACDGCTDPAGGALTAITGLGTLGAGATAITGLVTLGAGATAITGLVATGGVVGNSGDGLVGGCPFSGVFSFSVILKIMCKSVRLWWQSLFLRLLSCLL